MQRHLPVKSAIHQVGKVELYDTLSNLPISPNKTAKIIKKTKAGVKFLFIVKAAVLKQEISKFYPQIQRTKARDHIYFSRRLFINVKAIFCG